MTNENTQRRRPDNYEFSPDDPLYMSGYFDGRNSKIVDWIDTYAERRLEKTEAEFLTSFCAGYSPRTAATILQWFFNDKVPMSLGQDMILRSIIAKLKEVDEREREADA